MKKYFLILCAILLFSIALFSQNLKKAAVEARDENMGCFIQLMDSSIIKYKTLEYRLPLFTWGALIGDKEKLKYGPDEILAYQTGKGYFLRVASRGKISTIMFDYCFAERIRKGSIEFFVRISDNGRSHMDKAYMSETSYFFRKGSWVSDIWKDGGSLKNAVKDRKQVYNNFDDVYDKGRIKNIIAVVDMYNEQK